MFAAVSTTTKEDLGDIESYGLSSYLQQRFLHHAMGLMGRYARRTLEEDCANAAAVQEETLMKYITANKDTSYGKAWGFDEVKNTDDFRRSHPLTRYDHYEAYIRRVADRGEANVLTAEPVSRLGLTSGTSGRPHELPVVPQQRSVFFRQGIMVVFDTIRRHFPEFQRESIQRTLKLFYTPTPRLTKSGLTTGPNSSAPQDSKRLLQLYSTPPLCYEVAHEPSALYLYTLFALRDRRLGAIESNFVSAAEHFFRALRQDWPHLMRDVREGTIRPDLDLPPHGEGGGAGGG